jgi:hypothetical protein
MAFVESASKIAALEGSSAAAGSPTSEADAIGLQCQILFSEYCAYSSESQNSAAPGLLEGVRRVDRPSAPAAYHRQAREQPV